MKLQMGLLPLFFVQYTIQEFIETSRNGLNAFIKNGANRAICLYLKVHVQNMQKCHQKIGLCLY